MKDLGVSGTLISGKKMSGALQASHVKGLVYGPRQVEGSTGYELALARDVQARARWPEGKHPEGSYRQLEIIMELIVRSSP